MALSMANMAAVADKLAAEFAGVIPARVVTVVVFDVATSRPTDDRAAVEAAARARLTDIAEGEAPEE